MPNSEHGSGSSRVSRQTKTSDKPSSFLSRVKNRFSKKAPLQTATLSIGSESEVDQQISDADDCVERVESKDTHRNSTLARNDDTQAGGRPSQARWTEIAITAVDWTLPALKAVREVAAVFPPADTALGAVIGVLEVCQVCLAASCSPISAPKLLRTCAAHPSLFRNIPRMSNRFSCWRKPFAA